jgi:hypothetical protein
MNEWGKYKGIRRENEKKTRFAIDMGKTIKVRLPTL